MPTESSTFAQGPTLGVEALGDRALLVILGKGIDPAVNDQVHRLAALLRDRRLPGVHDLVPAYATVTVHYDPAAWSGGKVPPHEALRREIIRLWKSARTAVVPPPRQVEIPVCYGGAFGPDLAEVASLCALSEEEVIARHAAASYRVYMIGFSPGFAYLGGLDATIAAPGGLRPGSRSPQVRWASRECRRASIRWPRPAAGRSSGELRSTCSCPPRRIPACSTQATACASSPSMPRPSGLRRGDPVSLRVESFGLLTTIQDLGRRGFQHLGVGPGGAMDEASHRMANLLLGNPAHAPTLEMTLTAPACGSKPSR
jgi:KipI family sensor histidine kinase inhibitor